MIGQILGVNALLLLAYMSLWFCVARYRRRLDTVDTAWGLGFVVVAWSVQVQSPSKPSLVVAVLVSIWGLRLGSHIWRRSLSHQEDDRRYQDISARWQGNYWLRAYFSIFIVQGILLMTVSLPIVLLGGKIDQNETIFVIGKLVWLVGFAIEVIGDHQLKKYLSLKDRPKVLETGLWRYSRHPNYFGELLLWWGIGIIALQAQNGWIGLAGPLALSVLIIFVSGIPPIEARRAKDVAYRDYQQRTSPLVPMPRRKTDR